jgi:hypothetical protein
MATPDTPDTEPDYTTLRADMPENYLRDLAKLTGATQQTIWAVVNKPRLNSRYMPAVVALAKQTKAARLRAAVGLVTAAANEEISEILSEKGGRREQ